MKVTRARSFYRTAVENCRHAVKSHFTKNGVLALPPPASASPSGSGPDMVHYSFDFAQQVHYPHNPLQPGPMYFKTARKCAVFGVCCEGIPRQINYLIDEASDVGKGANTVVSLLHHFFQVDVGLHAYNCVGQNKNNTVLQVCTVYTLYNAHYFLLLPTHTYNSQYLASRCETLLHGRWAHQVSPRLVFRIVQTGTDEPSLVLSGILLR